LAEPGQGRLPVFNWKGPKSYAKSCKTLKLDLGEGAKHTALFMFTKRFKLAKLFKVIKQG
ncbi:MAG: hypothetical protein L0177_06000, partial [Chloroflexi bacterium]|nr:hypothetical protein [Chloroflexota bacterium]